MTASLIWLVNSSITQMIHLVSLLITKYLYNLKNKYQKYYTNVLGDGVKFKQPFNIKQILSIG